MKRIVFNCLLLLLWFPGTGAAEDPPPWMRQAASSVPVVPPKATAVVLLNESRVTVESGGRFITTTRRVIRLISREARSRLAARAVYRTDGGKVRDLNAWLIRPSSAYKTYDKPIDVAAVNDDVYNEVRLKVLSAADDAEAGSVFGYESVTEELSPFTQLEWDFQDDLPTLVSRLVVDLPDDWTAQSLTFNHAPVEPIVTRSARTWELRDLPGVDDEPYMPSLTHLVPRLAITLAPPAGKKLDSATFQNWREVSVWLAGLNDPQAQPTAALAAKAQELTAGVASEWDKIQSIARYVQGIQYISIQTGIGRGGGYKPHTAGDIFAKSYGDCKDKVTVMRAMLMTLGISSYPIAIYSGDASYVNEMWPSPQQFNHAIIAIKISDSTASPISIEHPAAGRLLIFDPTDPDTPLGDLPEDEQDSFGLLAAGDSGALLRMPVAPSEGNRNNRNVEVALGADGSIQATLQEESIGQAATAARGAFRHQSAPDFTRQIERWIGQSVTGAAVANIQPDDKWTEGRFLLKGEFKAAGYGRLMNNRLLVFKAAVLNRRDSFNLGEPPRKNPVVLRSQKYSDTVRVKLPDGFQIDEMPDAVKLESAFGAYVARYNVSGDQLVFERNLVLQSIILPPEQYPAVRDFFQQIMTAEQASVVLIRR